MREKTWFRIGLKRYLLTSWTSNKALRSESSAASSRLFFVKVGACSWPSSQLTPSSPLWPPAKGKVGRAYMLISLALASPSHHPDLPSSSFAASSSGTCLARLAFGPYVDLAYLRASSKLLMALIFSPIWPIFGKVDKNLSKKSCIRKMHHENNWFGSYKQIRILEFRSVA